VPLSIFSKSHAHRYSFWFFTTLFFVLSVGPEKAFSRTDRLPTPKGLKSSVDFWEDIFQKYQPNHCLVHDRKYPKIVYGAWKVRMSSRWRRQRDTRKTLNRVVSTLKKLGRGKSPRGRYEKKIYLSVPRKLRSSRFFKLAANRARCQRGVDLRPSIKKSKKYLPMIRKIFKKHGLPSDLAYLPHLESGFNRKARSKAGAVGMWQLMSGTARGKLSLRRRADSRKNPRKSTIFAAKHLKHLYKKTKSWPLAITAYNYGINGTRRAIRKYGRNYMSIRKRHKTSIFKFAAKNYYPSFLAVRNIAEKKGSRGRVNRKAKKKVRRTRIAARSTYPRKMLY